MGLGLVRRRDLCRTLDFLNVLYVSQQLGNRMLPGVRLEPWKANAPKCPAKAASGRFCRPHVCVKHRPPKPEHLENLISETRHTS